MFSLMGNCFSSICGKKGPRRKLTVAILGLDNAGKTLTSNVLQGEPMHTAPTVGFQKTDLRFGNYDLVLFDLGGGKKIRGIWKKYLADVYGVVYVVDSSDPARIEESTTAFKEVLEHPKISGKPILVLANKQDVEGAFDEIDICENMKLEQLVNANKCPCRVEMCSAVKGTGRKKDKAIKEGLMWLCDMINLDIDRIQPRVEKDLQVRDEERKKELAERKERVRKIKEEREKAEREERLKQGLPEREDSDEGGDTVDGDPFRRLNFEELKQKEAKSKAEKKKKKAEQEINAATMTTVTTRVPLMDGKANKASEQNSLGRLTNGLGGTDDDEDVIITSPSPRHSKLPPLDSIIDGATELNPVPETTVKKKWKKKRGEGLSPRITEYNEMQPMQLTPVDGVERSPRFPPSNELFTTATNHTFTNGHVAHRRLLETGDDGAPMGLQRRQLAPLDSIDQGEVEKKKRRKKVKKNKLAPSEEGGVCVSDTPRPLEFDRSPLPWDTSNNFSRPAARAAPKLEVVTESHDAGLADGFKWSLAEELPEVRPVVRRSRPNYDDDDIVT